MRQLYPNKKLTLVFQPHLFTRTRDFVDGFAEVLGQVDELLLMEIYPARELPIPGVDSTWLLEKINLTNKRVVSPQEVLDIIQQEKPELVVTVGAGDIDRLVKPIKVLLEEIEVMKRIRWNIVLYSLLGISALAGMAMLMSLIARKADEQPCKQLKVVVEGKETFIDQQDISSLILDNFGNVIGVPLKDIETEKI